MVILRRMYSEYNENLVSVIDSLAFLHFGISLTFRLSYDKNFSLKEELKLNRKYLDDDFST